MLDDDESQDPMYVEIPRSAKLFRVLLERKLGIDWEHDNIGSEESSLQTNWNHQDFDAVKSGKGSVE
jgi:hypothetical protein